MDGWMMGTKAKLLSVNDFPSFLLEEKKMVAIYKNTLNTQFSKTIPCLYLPFFLLAFSLVFFYDNGYDLFIWNLHNIFNNINV